MAFKLSPVLNEQQFSNAGILLSGGKIETYLAGSSTPATTYNSPSGAVAQANPIILNSRGEVDNLIYLTTGISYKLVLKDSLNNVLRTYDNIEGVNDSSLTIDQWVNSGVTPTFVNATQFTLQGDQTSAFHVNRRVKLLVTAGTVYGYISASAFAAVTTVTVVLDSGVLDSGLSNVQLGLITPNNTSLFLMKTANIDDLAVTPVKLSSGAPNWGANGVFTVVGTVPDIIQYKTDNALDEKYWRFNIGSQIFSLQTVNDIFSSAASAYDVSRVANVVNAHTWYTNGVARAGINVNGVFFFNSGYGSSAAAYGCRAWVNFNGTGVVAIRASANVSSITDNGVGDYSVNFTIAMPDANYSAVATPGNSTVSFNRCAVTYGYTTSLVKVTGSTGGAGAGVDFDNIHVAIFR